MIGRVLNDRYEISRRVATGGMATVYVAMDHRLDREVALKVMHSHMAENADFVARFRREARSAAKLAHSGIVSVFDQGQDGSVVYLAMEYVDGQTLRELLTQLGALTPDEAFDVLDQVLSALGEAHRVGLVHRDIKPENVLITSDGTVKVADFGVARATGDSTTSSGTVMGTVAYLSPELLTEGAADARADVYSTGILLFEMLTGTQPFTGEAPIQVAYRHVNEAMPLPSDRIAWLPPQVDELVSILSAKNPADRPANALTAQQTARALMSEVDPSLLSRRADVRESIAAAENTQAMEVDAVTGLIGPFSRTPEKKAAAVPPPVKKPAPTFKPSPKKQAQTRPATREVKTRPNKHARWRRNAIVAAGMAVLLALVGIGGVNWYYAAGPGSYTTVPNVLGVTQDIAVDRLGKQELNAETTEVFSSVVDKGMVMQSDPSLGSKIKKNAKVTLTISKGPDYRAIPKVDGMEAKKAQTEIEAAGLKYSQAPAQFSDKVEKGKVISQTPKDTDQAIAGDTITVVVSKGREPFDIPDVGGLKSADAQKALTSQGFAVAVNETFSDNVAKGVVVSMSPKAGGQAFKGDTITIYVSKGKDEVTVPKVVGKKLGDAKKSLEGAGLKVKVDPKAKNDKEVTKQSPGDGKKVKRGSEVSLTVEK